MTLTLQQLITMAGLGQIGVLVASLLVPSQLNWREELRGLSRLHRQMHWVYGGYVALSITAFAALSIAHAGEIASGTGLARGFCAYVAVFWGVRLLLQGVFDVKPYLKNGWWKAGYAILTFTFTTLVLIYGWAAIGPGANCSLPIADC